MNIEYYSLPLRPDKLLKGEVHEKCSLKESIAQHIHLIITTAFGELQQDENFGCSIWDCDFDNLTASNKVREKIKLSVQQSVLNYEQRLQAVKVDVFIKEQELNTTINGRQVKKRLDVQITAVNKVTNEKFMYQDSFFTGPLSYY
jgi:phage baseplate assembly protein W